MCTLYSLQYECGHTQISHRCPKTTSTLVTGNGTTQNYTLGCYNKSYLYGKLDGDCMECKLQKGIDFWAARTHGAAVEVKSTRSGSIEHGGSAATPTTNWRTSMGMDMNVSPSNEIDVDERLTEAFARGMTTAFVSEGQMHSTSMVTNSGTTGEMQTNVPDQAPQPIYEEDEEDWVRGAMKGFGSGEARKNRTNTEEALNEHAYKARN